MQKLNAKITEFIIGEMINLVYLVLIFHLSSAFTIQKTKMDQKRTKELKHTALSDVIESESLVEEILKDNFKIDMPERKLLVKLSEKPRYNALKTPSRKGVGIETTVPHMKSYHPITLAFFGTYDMSVSKVKEAS